MDYSDQITISVQVCDAHTLPYNSYLDIVGKLGKDGEGLPKMQNLLLMVLRTCFEN